MKCNTGIITCKNKQINKQTNKHLSIWLLWQHWSHLRYWYGDSAYMMEKYMRNVLYMSVWDNAYLIPHLGTGMNVKAQVVVGQLGGLFLHLPGESDLPVAVNTQTHFVREGIVKKKKNLRLHAFRNTTYASSLVLLLLTVMAHSSTTLSFAADPA